MGKWRRVKSLPRRWQRARLVDRYGNECFYCHKPMTMKQITIDHYMPLAKGGQDVIENYRLAHYACNQLKADLTPEEFIEFQGGGLKFDSDEGE
jgi:5-methylcytosine-specific restriction endonuclease McrA